MTKLDGWEIDASAQDALLFGKTAVLDEFARAYGPLVGCDVSRRILVVLRRYHPNLNCSPNDSHYPSDDYSIGLAVYTESSYTYFRLPKSLTYQHVHVERSATHALGSAIFDIEIATAEHGLTRTNTQELMQQLPNFSPTLLTERQMLDVYRQLTSQRITPPQAIPITSKQITLSAVGDLTPSDFADWWSTTTMIPLVGLALPVTFAEFNPQDRAQAPRLAKANTALTAFLKLGPADRRVAGTKVIANCHAYIDAVGAETWNDAMARCDDPDHIWDFVHPQHVYIEWHDDTRRMYVTLACNCDWEEEHGLQLVYRDGAMLTRVSEQDGHLVE
jgi:hypothetical protein